MVVYQMTLSKEQDDTAVLLLGTHDREARRDVISMDKETRQTDATRQGLIATTSLLQFLDKNILELNQTWRAHPLSIFFGPMMLQPNRPTLVNARQQRIFNY